MALVSDAGLLTVKEDNSRQYSHAEKLHIFIEEILRENGLGVIDLDAVAISKGPGSYTGLRIGVSAAKGLCFSLDIPLISISTLNSLAHQVQQEVTIIPMLDARRMEVYAGVFDARLHQIREIRAEILTPESFKTYLEQGQVTFIGPGAGKFREICSYPTAQYMDDRLPSAREMGAVALEKYHKGDTEDVAYFEPFYLKDFVAG